MSSYPPGMWPPAPTPAAQGLSSPRRGRGPLLVLGSVAAVIVVAIAGGLVWWTTHRQSSDSDGPVPGQLTKEFPTAPSVAWKVTADQFGARAFTLLSPEGDGFYAFPPALVDDGGLAISVPGPSDGTRTRHLLAGVNTATGKPWTTQFEANCAPQIVVHLIACTKNPNDEQQDYAFVDVRNGTQTGTAVPPDGLHGTAAFDGHAIYLTGSDANGSQMRVTKLDGAGRLLWSVHPDIPIKRGPGFARTTIGRGLVGSSMDGTAVLAASDGRLLSKNVGAGEVLADGSLVGSTATSNSQGMPTGYEVVHPDGTTTELPLLENPLNGGYGPTQQRPAITSRDLAGTAMVSGRLYKPGATASTWPEATWISRIILVTDRVTVGVTDKGALQGYDTKSGQKLWTGTDGTVAPASSQFIDAMITDGRRIITLDDGGTITATDAATGSIEWKMQGPTPTAGSSYNNTGSEKAYAYLYPAGDKFVVITGDSITAYGATGGPAHEPGTSTTQTGSRGGQGGGYYTRCGTPPIFTPQKFRTASGGLVVTVKVTAKCPGGDVLGTAGTSISIRDDAGMIASGTFDFSANPIGIAPSTNAGSGTDPGGTTIELTFPPGSFWRLPDTLGTDSAGVDSSVGVAAKPGILVECERPSGGVQQAASPAAAPSSTAASRYTPSGTDVSGNCSHALRSQADSDRSFIMSKLNGHWLAQLSSKHPGLVADGKVWDDCAILDEFLALRLRFTDVRMLWSDEWSVFSYQGWWVTVAAATFPGPDDANAWCRQQGFDNEHCFAKLISTSASSDGSTKYWK